MDNGTSNEEKQKKRQTYKILLSDFHCLSGKVQFVDNKLAHAHIFQIVNVMGKSYRELGFWSNGLGLSESINEMLFTALLWSNWDKCFGQEDLGILLEDELYQQVQNHWELVYL